MLQRFQDYSIRLTSRRYNGRMIHITPGDILCTCAPGLTNPTPHWCLSSLPRHSLKLLSSLALSLCDCACTLLDNFVLVSLRLLCLDSTVICCKPCRCVVTKDVVLCIVMCWVLGVGGGAPTEQYWSGCHAPCLRPDESQARMAGRRSQMVSSIPPHTTIS